jgi:hypothetical protein
MLYSIMVAAADDGVTRSQPVLHQRRWPGPRAALIYQHATRERDEAIAAAMRGVRIVQAEERT